MSGWSAYESEDVELYGSLLRAASMSIGVNLGFE
jgi:hypothetical protein